MERCEGDISKESGAGWLVMMQDWQPGIAGGRSPPPTLSHVSCAGGHLGDRCLRYVCARGRGQQVRKCFIQMSFAYLFQCIANTEGTMQISGVEEERNLGDVRGSFQGSLLHVMETGPSRCHKDASPHGFMRPRTWVLSWGHQPVFHLAPC